MDNEAPNYASWIPEAGGYVANGKVVSKTPQYDANGRLVDIDVSQFPNTTPNTSKAQPQVANQPIVNSGITTANTQGSGTDANAPLTQAGSLGTLENNLGKAQDSAISSPATRSIVAGKTVVSPEDEVNQEYQQAVARGDLQGQINALTKASRLTGQDYSTEIQNLTRQRQQKIQGIDDAYLQRINDARQKVNTAKSTGDITGDYSAYYQALEELNNLQGEQGTWRNAVGYDQAMQDMYTQEMEDLDIDYKETWVKSYNDIANQIVQALPGILNFQYNPMNDTALQIAQGYATSRVKEQMNSTGMYYSSMTQNAITKAVAELVPVYEKMARQEAIENFNLLQQTANFLMNLEETQFNMWKSQIQMKWQANDEKRKAVDQAIQNANARGFYTNEEAALLGIEPGTESQAARERALDKQEQIEKEARNLKQSMALAEYNAGLELQLAEEKAKISLRYSKSSGGGGSSGSGLTFAEAKGMVESYAKGGFTADQLAEAIKGMGLSQADAQALYLHGIATMKQEAIKANEADQKVRSELFNVSGDANQFIGDTTTLKRLDNFLGKTDPSVKDITNFFSGLSNSSDMDKALAINNAIRNNVYSTMDETFDSANKTKLDDKISSSLATIEKYENALNNANVADRDIIIKNMYMDLFDKIDNTGDKNAGKKKQEIIDKLKNKGDMDFTVTELEVANSNYKPTTASDYVKTGLKAAGTTVGAMTAANPALFIGPVGAAYLAGSNISSIAKKANKNNEK